MQTKLMRLCIDTRGTALALVAISLSILLFLVAALADIATAYVLKTRMQTIADTVTAEGGALVNNEIIMDASANNGGQLLAGVDPTRLLTDRNRDTIVEDAAIRRAMDDRMRRNLDNARIIATSADADYPVPFNTKIQCDRDGARAVTFHSTIKKKIPFLFARLLGKRTGIEVSATSQESIRLCPSS